MEHLTVLQLVYCAGVLVLTYAIRGTTGFGGLNAPLLAVVLPVPLVAPVISLLGAVSSAAILAKDWRHVSLASMRRVLPFCVAGVALGLYFFKTLRPQELTASLGVMVIVYGGYSLWQTVRPSVGLGALPWWAIVGVVGTIGGFVGTLFGSMAGVFFAVYLHVLRLDKTVFRATSAALLFVLGLLRIGGYGAIGMWTRDVVVACAVAFPLMVVGMFIGNHIHANVSGLAFNRIVGVLFILSGVPLLTR